MSLSRHPCTFFFPHGIGLVLIYSIFRWGVVVPQASFDRSEVLGAIGLLGCALTLTVVGYAVMAIATRWLSRSTFPTRDNAHSHMPHMSVCICALVLGQLIAITWVFVRSALSGITYHVTGRQLPISTFEVLLLLTGAVYVVVQRRSLRPVRSNIVQLMAFAGVALCVVTPLAFRELPRTVALSSDPDQHAFWASQVYNLGIVPWDQGLTGVGPFGYPAGFAVLNAIWMAFSGLSAVELVTIQPMLQFLLAVVTCAAVAPLLYRSRRESSIHSESAWSHSTVTLAALSIIAVYWFILPYGLQTERWRGEGTARLSTSSLSAIVVLVWLVPWGTSFAHRKATLALLVTASATCLIATINPLSALLPLCVLSCIGLRFLWHGAQQHRLGETTVTVTAIGALSFLILGGEPYLVTAASALLNQARTSIAPVTPTQLVYFDINLASYAPLLSLKHLMPYLWAGTLISDVTSTTTAGVCLLLGVWVLRSPRIALRWLMVLWLCGATTAGARGLRSTGVSELPSYLVAPYVYEAALQIGAILGYVLLVATLCAALSMRRIWIGHTLLLGLAVWLSTRHQSISEASASFALQPRECGPHTPYCLTQSDQNALMYVQQLGLQIRARYPNLSYEQVPKIMILGVPKRGGREQWVFPSDAARVVPLYSSIPVAFFYGRGSRDWSFDNYTTRVCKRLDMAWLIQRNVRYLFLSKRDFGCMKRRSDVVRRSMVLFNDEGARIVQLF